MKTCPNCHEEIADEAKFCGHCGGSVVAASQSNELTVIGFAPTAKSDHITSLGFELERSTAPNLRPLLQACGMEPIDKAPAEWSRAQYLTAKTRAGGVAAAIGWNRAEDVAVLHSLAVAPTTRGGGIGAGMLASSMAQIMEEEPVQELYLLTPGSRIQRLFESAGFSSIDFDDVPETVKSHPLFTAPPKGARAMVRDYGRPRRSLDNSAFRVVINNTPGAKLPRGSVFFFRQNGGIIEADYRGGPVKRGHIIGAVHGEQLQFAWHSYIDGGDIQTGRGSILIQNLPDGRRELTQFSRPDDSFEENELVLQEL